MASLCTEGTRWLESSSKKKVRRMDLRLESKVWYKFLKHSLCPTTHSETISKSRLLLLHCITSMSAINIRKIIVQEIHAFSKKKDGMVYFPCLILCCANIKVFLKRPHTRFVNHTQPLTRQQQTLMKPKGGKRTTEAGQEKTVEEKYLRQIECCGMSYCRCRRTRGISLSFKRRSLNGRRDFVPPKTQQT